MLHWLWEFFDDPATAEAKVMSQLLRGGPELPEWSLAVQPVLTRLLISSQIRQPMVSRVLTMPVLNALALPYTTIVLTQSLVEFCRDERDQLAFVLGHEAAHIHLGHAKERSRASAMAAVVKINPIIGMGMKMLFDRAFSREQEYEADRLAVTLCMRAGYSPHAGVAFLTRLGSLVGSARAAGDLLSTHPPLQERVGQLQAVIRGNS